MLNLQERAIIVPLDLPITLIIMDNNGYARYVIRKLLSTVVL